MEVTAKIAKVSSELNKTTVSIFNEDPYVFLSLAADKIEKLSEFLVIGNDVKITIEKI